MDQRVSGVEPEDVQAVELGEQEPERGEVQGAEQAELEA